MKFGLKFSSLGAVTACSAALLLGACASLPGTAAAPEDIVRERAEARWKSLIAGDWEKAYSLTAPSYRAVVDLDRYRAKVGKAATWVGAEVVGVTCEADACTARVRLDFKPVLGIRSGNLASTHVDEKWVEEEGGWWLFQQL